MRHTFCLTKEALAAINKEADKGRYDLLLVFLNQGGYVTERDMRGQERPYEQQYLFGSVEAITANICG